MKIIFMGTPEFAKTCLEGLHKNKHDIALVITQPDKPQGRGKKLVYSAVKSYAVQENLMLFQPQSIKKKDAIEYIKIIDADIFIVAAFGQILPQSLLSIPKYGAINVHASLLPKYRGASPIQAAIINGETKTGITIMQMDKGLDTGEILLQSSVNIESTDTAQVVHDKLCAIAYPALNNTLELIKNNKLHPIKQDNTQASYAPLLTREMGHINWQSSPQQIVNLVRGYNPYPSAYCIYNGKNIKIWDAEAVEHTHTSKIYGEILEVTSYGITVAAADKNMCVRILELQPAAGKRMRAAEYIKGHSIAVGDMLG